MDAQEIKLRRRILGKRQIDIAAALGLSTSKFCMIENGDLRPSPDEMVRIEQVLQLPEATQRLVSTLTAGVNRL